MSEQATKYMVSPAAVRALLAGDDEFLSPQRLLGDLTEAQALAVPPGSLYSIAGIVAHMHFWQERGIALALGGKPSRPEHLDDTFPTPQPGDWDALRLAFLDGLATCAQVAAEQGAEASRGRREASVGFDLAACPALHSAYHYGQIAILRQIQGLWPPEGGDDSW